MAESLRGRALKLLAQREHSRKELARKLSAHTEDEEEITRLLDDFEARGWLSERRVVEQMVHARRSRYGALRIERDLQAKGVSGEAISDAMQELKKGELEAARAVWRRKFGGNVPRDAAGRARQARFLQGRGFSMDVVMRILKSGGED